MGSDFIEWGTLAASLTGDTIAAVDSERHLYVTNFRHRVSLGRRGETICPVLQLPNMKINV